MNTNKSLQTKTDESIKIIESVWSKYQTPGKGKTLLREFKNVAFRPIMPEWTPDGLTNDLWTQVKLMKATGGDKFMVYNAKRTSQTDESYGKDASDSLTKNEYVMFEIRVQEYAQKRSNNVVLNTGKDERINGRLFSETVILAINEEFKSLVLVKAKGKNPSFKYQVLTQDSALGQALGAENITLALGSLVLTYLDKVNGKHNTDSKVQYLDGSLDSGNLIPDTDGKGRYCRITGIGLDKIEKMGFDNVLNYDGKDSRLIELSEFLKISPTETILTWAID